MSLLNSKGKGDKSQTILGFVSGQINRYENGTIQLKQMYRRWLLRLIISFNVIIWNSNVIRLTGLRMIQIVKKKKSYFTSLIFFKPIDSLTERV